METRSKRRKRQRLMSISSNVSSWPDVPARFESLNDDMLTTILQFVGNKSYRSFGGLNYHCKEIYLNTPGMTKETFLFGYGSLSVIIDKIEKGGRFNQILHEKVGKGVVLYNRRDVLSWAIKRKDEYLLSEICNVAGKEGRIDILDEVWNNMNNKDEKEYIFEGVDEYAARGGKLEVFKWLKSKRIIIKGFWCANRAAEKGHPHIIQWLREYRGLELYEGLYMDAISGGHLHVMKWLREQEEPWAEWTFQYAAKEGNLDILQWLHDEGCLWPDNYYRVDEHELKPEALEWLRVNGYGNRIRLDRD